MKTRGQIYSQEAAGLLRDISMYQALRKEQLLRLYPGKRGVIQNLLSYLLKQHRIIYEDGLYFPAPDRPDNIDWGLINAVWVLVDFIDRVEYHVIGEVPAKLTFIAEGTVYEVVYMEQGKETMLAHVMGQHSEEPPNYLVIVDSPEQIAQLNLPNTCGYCTVSPDGEVEYYQKE